MGARPSSFKKGGGWLNGVDATIVGYQFICDADVAIKNGKRKGETWSPINLVPEFREDGASETKTQKLLVGDMDKGVYGEISGDGLTLGDPNGVGLRGEAGTFVASLCDSPNFPEDRFSEETTSINLQPMIGTRLRLVQETDARATEMMGKQKGKDGKEYDRKALKVETVYSVVPLKTGTKTVAAKGKANGRAIEVNINAAGDEVVAALVERAGGTLNRSQLSSRLQTAKAKYPDYTGIWSELSQHVIQEATLADMHERGIVKYKAQTLTSAS